MPEGCFSEWAGWGADQSMPTTPPEDPDFKEFRQYASDLWASHFDSADDSSSAAFSHQSLNVPPLTKLFISNSDKMHYGNLGHPPSTEPVQLQTETSLAEAPANKKRRRPVSKSASNPTLHRRKRARTAAWFD
ncbi:hypothetical protein NQ176_g1250 [Zarea fungicola]|uniref:Uncharacterized protein n=1 Tax=Zarea fungicola TaxID=93591 RepID=A0ACC1NTM1_9HYPO|nr:hypothetical protein NQ176_g1250 [Lecanicillium fungicola]